MIKAVLFDMYRTLGEDVGHRHFIDELIEHGIALEDAKRIMLVADADAFDGAEHYEFSVDSEKYAQWREQHLYDVLLKHGLAQDISETIVNQHKTWRAGFISKLKPYPETFEVLSDLKGAGFQIGVCSNWDWDINVVVDDLGIGEVVDYVISSAQLGVRKPHPAFFERILDSMHLSRDDAVFVGDTWATDIQGATGIGMSAIWVDRLDRTVPDDRANVARVQDLRGVRKILNDHPAFNYQSTGATINEPL